MSPRGRRPPLRSLDWIGDGSLRRVSRALLGRGLGLRGLAPVLRVSTRLGLGLLGRFPTAVLLDGWGVAWLTRRLFPGRLDLRLITVAGGTVAIRLRRLPLALTTLSSALGVTRSWPIALVW